MGRVVWGRGVCMMFVACVWVALKVSCKPRAGGNFEEKFVGGAVQPIRRGGGVVGTVMMGPVGRPSE